MLKPAPGQLYPPVAEVPYLRPTGLAIYVHWPWCQSKCPYCDFNSHARGADQADAYQAALLQELEGLPWAQAPGALVSVFFGGGTPSLMGAARVAAVLETINRHTRILPSTEITVECNPTSTAPMLLAGLRSAGVNRVSLGVQSLTDADLQFLGRHHTVADALATLDAAQTIFSNVNADVMYGLPGQQLHTWEHLLGDLAQRGLAHISAYQLTVEKNTPFWSAVARGQWQPADNDTQADFFETTAAVLGAAGYENYEISNFARSGLACQHNLHVWHYRPYWGVGAGAHGRHQLPDGTWLATANPKQPEAYIRLSRATPAGDFLVKTALNQELATQERFMMGLRLNKGLHIFPELKTALNGVSCGGLSAPGLALHLKLGTLQLTGDTLRLSPRGWSLLDTVLSDVLVADATA